MNVILWVYHSARFVWYWRRCLRRAYGDDPDKCEAWNEAAARSENRAHVALRRLCGDRRSDVRCGPRANHHIFELERKRGWFEGRALSTGSRLAAVLTALLLT